MEKDTQIWSWSVLRWWQTEFSPVFLICSPVLDKDVRFALANPTVEDVTNRCVVYVHKVLNARKDMSNQLLTDLEVKSCIFTEICEHLNKEKFNKIK